MMEDDRPCIMVLYGFDFEVETNQREDEALEILYQVVECSKTFRIFALVDIYEGTNFRSCERNMLISNDNFQFLSPNSIRGWPHGIILMHDV